MFIAAWEFTHKAAMNIKKGNIVGCVEKFSLSIKEFRGSQTERQRSAVIPKNQKARFASAKRTFLWY
jgi:hypothetical protein